MRMPRFIERRLSWVSWWIAKWAIARLGIDGNWPRWNGSQWEVYASGRWQRAPTPPYVYEASMGWFYKIKGWETGRPVLETIFESQADADDFVKKHMAVSGTLQATPKMKQGA